MRTTRRAFLSVVAIAGILGAGDGGRDVVEVRIPIGESREIDLADLVERLGRSTGIAIARPRASVRVPVVGLGGDLSRRVIGEILGPDAALAVRENALVVTLSPSKLARERSVAWRASLRRLVEHIDHEARNRADYGMHALKSYRPNDPRRPTICLVHGLNSSSGGFVYMVQPLEEAGYGIVVYDYPYNRSLEESCESFARDWSAFRKKEGETRPWAIVAHSMGALLARSYVEDPRAYGNDVSALLMVAPVNQGSSLAKAQTLLQLLKSVQAARGKKTTEALSQLGDGLGEAAADLTPGSAFLTALNARPRRRDVPYYILAGDVGILSRAARKQVEGQIDSIRREGGILGGLARAATSDMSSRLDEISDGTGDGCVSVARTRLEGVAEHVTIHANHAELIRAPLLFSEPGPVACMPYLLRWLKASRLAQDPSR